MSLIDLLADDRLWQDFLIHKKNSHLPEKVINEYEVFINNKKYKEIVDKIIDEKYEFSVPKKIEISKMGKSKKRVVYTYNTQETYVLKMLSYLLYQYDYLFSSNLYSFRQNSGVKKAIYKLKNCKIKDMFAYKVDIKNYFNSIKAEILLPDLKKDLKDDKLFNFIEQILINKKVLFQDGIIEEEKGIMAGVPLSAFLANYFLKDLDFYFADKKILYARYADDIIVFDKDMAKLKTHQTYIKNYLNQRLLEINEAKEFFYMPGEKIEFLGFSYQNGTIDLSENSIKKMKGKIKRTAKGLRRWMIKKNAPEEATLKAMNRKFNKKFFGKDESDLTWKYWFFPTINTTDGLKIIDNYLQEWERFIVTGVHNKKNFEKVPYSLLKQCNYKSLVHEYFEDK